MSGTATPIDRGESGGLKLRRSAPPHHPANPPPPRAAPATPSGLPQGDWCGGVSVLHLAAEQGHLLACRLLMQRGVPVDVRDDGLYTPLHYAAEAGHQELVVFLVGIGAAVDAVDKTGMTPLHYAAESGSHKAVQFLLDRNAAVEAVDKTGKVCDAPGEKRKGRGPEAAAGGGGLCLKGRGAIGAVPERLQSGHRGRESGWGRRFLAVGNAVGAGVGVWDCLSGRVSAVGRGEGGYPPPPFKRFPGGG